MYSKLYSSLLLSSVWSEDDETRLLWITLIAAADREGYVFGSAAGLATIARLSIERAMAALETLKSPDPYSADLSTSPENEGRRLEVVPGGWRLINYKKYRDLETADDRRHYEASRKARYRRRKRDSPQLSPDVPKSPPSESESESESVKRDLYGTRRFKPPTLEETREYFHKHDSTDYMGFRAFYESNGWRVGKNPMKNWKAAAAGWIMRNGGNHVR
jgi:hypothetical protein